jgi:4-amino-4-deoxy-L-arabinose transferase-like glycosyltransferase
VERSVAVAETEFDKPSMRRYLLYSILLVLIHGFFMAYRYGHLPIVPMVPEEVIINDASISLAHGHGYVATSFTDSKYGLDHLFAHFPPLYPYTQALAFRIFGISAYSLRLTTTVMSLCSTVVLLLILFRLCKARLLDWYVALLINAIYCTNASFVSFERMARMESMISLLTLMSLGAIFYAATQPKNGKVWPAMLAAGLFASLCMAVHPEAVTALVLLASLMFFVVPARLSIRLASLSLFAIVPLGVGLFVYGKQLLPAIHQFLAIAHDSNSTDPTSWEWLLDAIHNRDLSTMNRNLFLLLIMGLLAVVPLSYAWFGRKLTRGTLRYRLNLCLCVIGVIEISLMVFAFRMVDRRCQFLFGSLLICNAICLLGPASLNRRQKALGWVAVALQCCVVMFYFSARSDRVVDMNPDRFLPIIHRLPAGASVASTPGLWLDFQEAQRPFTLILYGLDGETQRLKSSANPMDRFDVVIIEDYYAEGKPWWAEEAQSGRTKYTYIVGSDLVDVYVRKSITLLP